jgi:hypothetical protein
MKARIEIQLKPAADTFCAAVKSMLDFLGDKHPMWEIEGLSGYAFRILVHRDICPSGTHHTNWTKFHPQTLRRLGWEPRFFLHIDWDRSESFPAEREKMLELIRSALGEGRPVTLYDLYVPGWGLATGYDDEERKLEVQTFLNLAHWGTVDFDKLGKFNLPILYALDAGSPLENYDRKEAYREALQVATRHYNLQEYAWRPKVRDGREAYNQWLSALRSFPDAKCMPEGMADYATKFGEWRTSAARFCREAAKMFPEKKIQLSAAAKDFEEEAKALGKLAKLFPMPGGRGINKAKVAQAIILVQDARTQYNAAIANMRAAKL